MFKQLIQRLKMVYEGKPRSAFDRHRPVRLILYVMVPTGLMFSVVNFLHGNMVQSVVEASVCLLLLTPLYWLLKKSGSIALCELIVMVSAVFIFFSLRLTGGVEGTGSHWSFIYPFLAFYINDQRRAWCWTGVFFLLMVLQAVVVTFGGVASFYPERELWIDLMIFVFYTWIAYVFMGLRNHYEYHLENQVAEKTKALKRHMRELKRKALYDDLTLLPNRYLFEDRLSHMVLIAQREETLLSVAVIDLSRFQEINNIMGHDKGDEVLRQMALRLSRLLRASDTAARIGADSFALILPKTDENSVHVVTRKLFIAMGEPFIIDGYAIELSINIGVAVAPVHGDKSEILLQRADLAMRQAKQDQMGVAAIYDQERDPYSIRRLTLYGKLRKAVDEGKLTLVYQPKIDLGDGSLSGVEALLRWCDPEDGFISPDEFIPMAEQTGLINRISEWVLKEVITQVACWRAEGFHVATAVNLSPRNLLNSTLPVNIESLLVAHGLEPYALCVEVTETALMSNPAKAQQILERLHEMHISLSIDDFGTGYSSLAYLKALPVDELKIDRCFIKNIVDNEVDRMIVESTVRMAHGLGLTVVAEGVEDEATFELLRSMAVDKVQGYYFTPPLPSDALIRWLKDRNLLTPE